MTATKDLTTRMRQLGKVSSDPKREAAQRNGNYGGRPRDPNGRERKFEFYRIRHSVTKKWFISPFGRTTWIERRSAKKHISEMSPQLRKVMEIVPIPKKS